MNKVLLRDPLHRTTHPSLAKPSPFAHGRANNGGGCVVGRCARHATATAAGCPLGRRRLPCATNVPFFAAIFPNGGREQSNTRPLKYMASWQVVFYSCVSINN